MNGFLESASQFGATALLAAALMVQNFLLQKKLIEVIENNTKAMTELRDHCRDACRDFDKVK